MKRRKCNQLARALTCGGQVVREEYLSVTIAPRTCRGNVVSDRVFSFIIQETKPSK